MNTFQFLKSVLIFTLIGVTSCAETSSESAEYINDPKVDDIYFIEQAHGEFTLMKIINIENDSIEFKMNKYNISLNREIDATYSALKYRKTKYLDEADNWEDVTVSFEKSQLKKQYLDKIIYEIKRI
ncbi:hypothetical protein [Winogradskyella sp. A3E31]|uniref:hypothetical protein n=1 Tax=Winogradskyella sp. A3E31 TaxID=3349637 RepID=UPI00398ACBB9